MRTTPMLRATTGLATVLLLTSACAGQAGPRFVAAPESSTAQGSSTTPKSKNKAARELKVADDPEAKVLGDLIDTGIPAGDGKTYVVYGLSSPMLLMKEFGFAAGTITGADEGVVTADIAVGEYEGSATAPGFHPMQAQMSMLGGVEQPAFGYYVGAPATVSVLDMGRTIRATLAPWSHDPRITVFWFDPRDVRDPENWSQLGAFDAAGTRLPDGHIELFTN